MTGPVKGIGHIAVNRYGRNFSLCSSAINCFLSSAVSFHWSLGDDAAESTTLAVFDSFSLYWSTPDLLFLGNTSFESHSASLISSVLFTNPHPFPLDSDFYPNSVACQDVPDLEGPPPFLVVLSAPCPLQSFSCLLGVCSWDVALLTSWLFSI